MSLNQHFQLLTDIMKTAKSYVELLHMDVISAPCFGTICAIMHV